MVGNPPFIGAARLRRALGDGYVDAVRAVRKDVPESADFVMYSTNSLRQTFNRRVLDGHLHGQPPLSLVFVIPDHPWVDASDGAAVRIAMTVAEAGEREGVLQMVRGEADCGEVEALEADRGRYLGFVRVVARRSGHEVENLYDSAVGIRAGVDG